MATVAARLWAKLNEKRELVTSVLLFATAAVLSMRASQTYKEIAAIEAERDALKASNAAMASSMFSWRQELFRLAETGFGSATPPISLSRLRAIYGEEEPAYDGLIGDGPTGDLHDGSEESVTIS